MPTVFVLHADFDKLCRVQGFNARSVKTIVHGQILEVMVVKNAHAENRTRDPCMIYLSS